MTITEADDFEKDPLYSLSIRLREWDERAKRLSEKPYHVSVYEQVT